MKEDVKIQWNWNVLCFFNFDQSYYFKTVNNFDISRVPQMKRIIKMFTDFTPDGTLIAQWMVGQKATKQAGHCDP